MAANSNGVRITAPLGDSVAPAAERTFPAGVDADSVSVVVETVDPVVASVDVWLHPTNPEGEYYGTYTEQVALATGVISAGENATILQVINAPCNAFGVTVRNNDGTTHEVGVIVYGNGDS